MVELDFHSVAITVVFLIPLVIGIFLVYNIHLQSLPKPEMGRIWLGGMVFVYDNPNMTEIVYDEIKSIYIYNPSEFTVRIIMELTSKPEELISYYTINTLDNITLLESKERKSFQIASLIVKPILPHMGIEPFIKTKGELYLDIYGESI